MRKMMLYGKKYGGADPQLIEGDNFRMIISVPEFGANPAEKRLVVPSGAESEQVIEQVTEQVRGLVVALAGKELGTRELMVSLQIGHRPTFLYDYLQPSLSGELVEMTQPESPKSPTQKYRLTEKGRKLLETIS